MSCLLGENRDIFFPKLSEHLHLITFSEIAVKYLEKMGYEPYLCNSEDEARNLIQTLPQQGKWPCLFAGSNTTGEKDFEEFFTDNETLDMQRFNNLGVIKNALNVEEEKLTFFNEKINKMLEEKNWSKQTIVELFNYMMPNFGHKETGLYLDGKM